MISPQGACTLALPRPISTNSLFANIPGKGRIATTEYKAWKKHAGTLIGLQRATRFTVPVEVALYVGEKTVGQMDVDNTAKAYLDALTAAGVIQDDSRHWVRSLHVSWIPEMGGCVAQVWAASDAMRAARLVGLIPAGFRTVLA